MLWGPCFASLGVAARQLLQKVLPARTPQEIDTLLGEFRQWFRDVPNGIGIEEMADGALDIASELFDAAVLGNANAFRAQWVAVMNEIQPAGQRFDLGSHSLGWLRFATGFAL